MREYTGFASVYDMFMDNVPYDEWADYLHELLLEKGIDKGIICELGCGTGRITGKLRDFGYDMIGIDISQEMLQIAADKEKKGVAGEIMYLNQDMREFELYGTVAAVVCICDGMNYIMEKEDLLKVFRLVNNYLDPNGVFIFDMNTPYYYRKILGEQSICENREEGSFIWENYYDSETMVNEFDMTIYIRRNSEIKNVNAPSYRRNPKSKSENSAPVYERFEETHYQKAYRINEVKMLLKRAGLKDIEVFEVLTHAAPKSNTERVYFISRESGKMG